LSRQLVILLVTMLMSKGATGFTGAGFVVLAATLAAMPDIPMAGLALLLGIDPFMQRGRGLTNYIGNGVAAIAVARWEGALDVMELNRRLDRGPDADFTAALGVEVAAAAPVSAVSGGAPIRAEERAG
ncbi:MAG: cation:dicarboxylase symporter family transporter, partial [Gammaproteobacteria bacterium]|nr:cation:dicarboxylase symporter family transporter [Gammaproteobacteria bacterium]